MTFNCGSGKVGHLIKLYRSSYLNAISYTAESGSKDKSSFGNDFADIAKKLDALLHFLIKIGHCFISQV